MTNCLIGYTGFVGNNLLNNINFEYKFNSKNINQILEQEYDAIYCCGISAIKWYSNLHPEEDLNNINKLLDILKHVKCKRFILISTIDVYQNVSSMADESSSFDNYENHAYGRNRLYVENFIKNTFKNYNIIRLPGLYGFGLKKNIIYDLINGNNPTFNLNSEFQWYDLANLVKDIKYVVKSDIKIINLFPEPITNHELMDVFKNHDITKYTENSSIVRYNIKTKYGVNGYWYSKQRVLSSLNNYINTILNNNLCLSNLTYGDDFDKTILDKYSIKLTEVVPNKTFGEGFIDKPLDYFDQWKNKNFYSMQSILYPLSENIFIENDRRVLHNYLVKLINIASYLNIKVLVFGSPKNRYMNEISKYSEAVSFFKTIGDYAYEKNVVVCIEPNSKNYGCNFITNSIEGRKLVLDVNSMGFKLHLDTGCMFMENEDIVQSIKDNLDILQHVHFSVPYLKNLKDSSLNFPYFYNELNKLNYKHIISVEMLNVSNYEIDKSLHYIVRPLSIVIVGSGWYGCHIAEKLINKGYIVEIYEKSEDIFMGASSKNQNRLHLGFHYPRSHATRELCFENYNKFIEKYGFSVDEIKNNYYIIANNSLIDYKTYAAIYRYNNIDFEEVINNDINNASGVILTKEKVINNKNAKKYFKELLFRELTFNANVTDFSDLKSDYVINCTNNQMQKINKINGDDVFFELTISLIYKCLDDGNSSYTVMDGNFFSLYPYDTKLKLYTLTHVTYTPIIKSKDVNDISNYTLTKDKLEYIKTKMEESASHYYSKFKNNYEYKDYFLSYKCKFTNGSDSRELVYVKENNLISLMCGKITGIFESDKLMDKYL
jgi:nucleoside-diphosphate-sugar epimerase